MFPNLQNVDAYESTFNNADRDQINVNQNSGGPVQIAHKISNVYSSQGEKQKRNFEPSRV